ncbi:MAG: DNA gyrase inhibitor YacG [Myxococcales bacterium]|nr:DNA gyrase inhibitor YacG [Myxococcales bacterium]
MSTPAKPMPPCPVCKKTAMTRESAVFPFCSKRCAMVDLSHWLDGSYRVPGLSDMFHSPTQETSDFAAKLPGEEV